MSEIEIMKRKIIKFIEETDDIEILNQIISMITQLEAKKKPVYFNSIDTSNLVNESDAIYQTQEIDDFDMPEEWMDEIEERSRRFRSGEDKGYTLDETMKMAHQHLETFRKNRI